MNIILISSLLDVALLVFQVAALEGGGDVPREPIVSMWPPGSNIFLGECVLLRCIAESNSTLEYNYRWYRFKPHSAATPNPRHLISGDSYSITAVTREDAGSYWCGAETKESNTSVVLNSKPALLVVSELTPPSLTVTPSTTQIFRGQRFTVQCPVSKPRSTGWKLRHFPPSHSKTTTVSQTDGCSPLGGAVTANESDACVFTAASVNSGLYWCEGAEGRTSTVNITVSYGNIILKTPAFPVSEGDKVVLYCQYQTGNHNKATFFKDGEFITSSFSISDRVIQMTIENVTKEDEGFYKCASSDGKTESPESWLSVRGSFKSTDASSNGSWIWIAVSCVVLLFLIPLIVWLVRRYRYQMFRTKSCWPFSKEDTPAVALPATKQDVTEVQWDLSWMEMSNLLDKQTNPGT